MKLAVLLFPGFEVLDVFGPVEMFGVLKEHFQVSLIAETPGPIASAQGVKALAENGLDDDTHWDIILVPGGIGTRREVENPHLLDWLRQTSARTQWVTSVCTGSALLARAGILDGNRATSNKKAFDWVTSQGPRVHWVRSARWVEDGKYLTSSGVTAGMDMALALIARILGAKTSEQVAQHTEYLWNRDPAHDPFIYFDKEQTK